MKINFKGRNEKQWLFCHFFIDFTQILVHPWQHTVFFITMKLISIDITIGQKDYIFLWEQNVTFLFIPRFRFILRGLILKENEEHLLFWCRFITDSFSSIHSSSLYQLILLTWFVYLCNTLLTARINKTAF